MAGSLPWKPPPPLPIPYLLGERIEAEPSPLGEKAPFWAVRSCPAERGWWRGAPSGQRQCQRPWASLVWSCSGCCQRLQRVSKAAQPYSVWGKGAAAQIHLGWCSYSQMPVYLSLLCTSLVLPVMGEKEGEVTSGSLVSLSLPSSTNILWNPESRSEILSEETLTSRLPEPVCKDA